MYLFYVEIAQCFEFLFRLYHLISETAKHMGTQTLFDGIEMTVTEDGIEVCNPAYWDAILAFLNSYVFDFDYTLYNYIADQL